MPRNFARDPVHEEDDGWYFWDETWSDRLGPYGSEEEARFALAQYAHSLDPESVGPF